MTRAGWNGLTTKSLAPSLMASSTFDSWPRAEHMTTRADGSAATISARAARPSFSGIVMSRVIRSGLSSWKRWIASTPLPASPTTSWPPLARASPTILRMNAASSTTSTRAIVNSIPSLDWGLGAFRGDGTRSGDRPRTRRLERDRRLCGGGGLAADEAVDLDGPLAAFGDDQPAGGEAHAVDEQVDRLVRLAVELDDGPGRRADETADRHPPATELGPDADLDLAHRLVEPGGGGGGGRALVAGGLAAPGGVGGGGRALVAEVLGAELVEPLRHPHDERVRDELDQAAGLAEDGEDAGRHVRGAFVALEGGVERREDARVRRGNLALGAEDVRRRVATCGHHLVHRLA